MLIVRWNMETIQSTRLKLSPRHLRVLLQFMISILTLHQLKLSYASSEECNFERYATGCFSQANFICDPETDTCKCHPEFPVLIEQRICLRKIKLNEICLYNEQCDNSKGLYCLLNDHRFVNMTKYGEFSRVLTAKCKPLGNEAIPLQTNSHHYRSNIKANHITHKQNDHYSTPRLVWIFLLACLVGLFVILFLIKSQYYSSSRSSRISVDSDLDVPPPYEVAIRMKI